jgi:phage N-6-adenine-methyltransferase
VNEIVARDNLIEVFEDMEKTIAEMTDIKEVLNTRNMAKGYEEAWKAYYRSSGLGFEQMFMGWEAKIISERKMGEMLRDMEKNKGAMGVGSNQYEVRSHEDTTPVLEDLGISKTQSSRYQQIAKIDDEKFDKVVEQMKNSFVEPTTKNLIATATGAHVGFNSGEFEWYTPPKYIEAAQFVMGKIDLDPASSKIANEIVKATKYYSEEDNGLAKTWEGNVWMNPPYSQPLMSLFCNKIISELKNGVTQACVLVNNVTETACGQLLLDNCTCACFPSGRIKFLTINKEEKKETNPLQGQMILYFGNAGNLFETTFKKFGTILWQQAKFKTEKDLDK